MGCVKNLPWIYESPSWEPSLSIKGMNTTGSTSFFPISPLSSFVHNSSIYLQQKSTNATNLPPWANWSTRGRLGWRSSNNETNHYPSSPLWGDNSAECTRRWLRQEDSMLFFPNIWVGLMHFQGSRVGWRFFNWIQIRKSQRDSSSSIYWKAARKCSSNPRVPRVIWMKCTIWFLY